MLYFIECGIYAKIGYTKDISTFKKRLSTYRTHNPQFRLVDITDGTQEDDIEKRVTRIEKKLNNLGILEKWIRNVEKKTNTTGDNILALSDKVEVVNSKVAENKESLHKLD